MAQDDRLFTAFVSSTFHDLRPERRRVASVLLDHSCLPLGMEFFPSDGRVAWSLIESSMARADFFVLVVGRAYGSVDGESGKSWTQREHARMVELRRPVVALLKALEPSEVSDSRLLAFREEIERGGAGCQYWSDEADLAEKLAFSVSTLTRRSADVLGWARVLPTHLQRPPSLWENALYRTTWSFSPADAPDLLDATVVHRRTFRPLRPEGITSIELVTRRPDTGHVLPLDANGGPRCELVEWSRSSGIGRAFLRDPVELSPQRYVRRLIIDPPLLPSETFDFEVRTTYPNARFAFRDDLVAATRNTRPREFDYSSAFILVPTEVLEIEVEFLRGANATIRGVEALNRNYEVDATERNRAFSAFATETDESGRYIARLRLLQAHMGMRYRVSWVPPDRG